MQAVTARMGDTSELAYYDDCPRVRAILDMYGAGSLNAIEVLGQPGGLASPYGGYYDDDYYSGGYRGDNGNYGDDDG